MDKIEKLLRKINKKDRLRLLEITEKLIRGKRKEIDIKKIRKTDFFRVRLGRFRIIFHIHEKTIIIDNIRVRNDKTYKRLKR